MPVLKKEIPLSYLYDDKKARLCDALCYDEALLLNRGLQRIEFRDKRKCARGKMSLLSGVEIHTVRVGDLTLPQK